jgi:hypothetical protein
MGGERRQNRVDIYIIRLQIDRHLDVQHESTVQADS